MSKIVCVSLLLDCIVCMYSVRILIHIIFVNVLVNMPERNDEKTPGDSLANRNTF